MLVEELFKIEFKGDELYRCFGGGIFVGIIMLVEGDRGSGKFIFVQRFFYGFLMNGYMVSYILSQYIIVEYIKQMEFLGYGIIFFLIRKKLVFVLFYFFFLGVSEKRKFLSRFFGELRLWELNVMIIDVFLFLFFREQDFDVVRDFFFYVKKMVFLDKVIIFIVNIEEIDRDLFFVFEEVLIMLICFNVKVFGGDLKNFVIIVKYNNVKGVFQKIIFFCVELKVGFIVEIVVVV